MNTWRVSEENLLPGSAGWRVERPGPAQAIEGFADRVSVLAGEPVRLFVTCTAPWFYISAYRMGWYGGQLARRVWRSEELRGTTQAPPVVDPGTNLVSAPWEHTTVIDTSGWPEGCYLLRLISSQGFDRWIPLTVRTGVAAGKLVFVNAVTTWAAYNRWGGGFNVDAGPDGKAKTHAQRSKRISFDRPYDNNGNPFSWYELPLLALAERLGLELAYATDIDLDQYPDTWRGASALIFPGHDEFWTESMRETVVRLRDAGTNLAFFGANAAARRIRLAPSDIGERRVLLGQADEIRLWRESPNLLPESTVTGVISQGRGIDDAFVVTDPDCWIYRGTGVEAGTAFPHLVAVEYDRLDRRNPFPRPLQVIASSPISTKGREQSGELAQACYYTVPSSGAGVFSSGTLGWSTSLPGGARAERNGEATTRFVEQVTSNILTAFAEGPCGLAHPALDNVERYLKAAA